MFFQNNPGPRKLEIVGDGSVKSAALAKLRRADAAAIAKFISFVQQVHDIEANNRFAIARKVLKMPGMTRIRDVKSWQGAIVFLLLTHLLIVVVLAASPQLHQLFHHDADHGNHQCIVTLMISGGSDGSPAPQVLEANVILPTVFNFPLEARSHDVAPLFLSAHVFEHAPPLA